MVVFNDEESGQYLFYKKIAPFVSKLENTFKKAEETLFNKYSGARSRLMASAVDKVKLLETQLKQRKSEKQMALFYVGDGQVDTGLQMKR